jgi:hypothetical protein
MNAVKELILGKLEHLEILSEPVLQEVLDYVSFLEWRLGAANKQLIVTSSSAQDALKTESDTSSFLLAIANGLSDENLNYLPTDGAENHLQNVLAPEPKLNLAEAIEKRFAHLGDFELPEITREPMRAAPNFEFTES